MENEPKKYHIDNFEKICNIINAENEECLLIDLMRGFAFYNKKMQDLREQYPDLTKGKTNWEILNFSINWIDDGKTHNLGSKIVNSQTGEETFIP
jgi:hypothetical protein